MEAKGSSSRKNSAEGLQIEKLEATMDEIFLPSTTKRNSGKTQNTGCKNLSSKVIRKKTFNLKESKDEICEKLNQLKKKSGSTVDDLNIKMKRLVSGSDIKTKKNVGNSAKLQPHALQEIRPVRFYIVQEIQGKTQQDEDACLTRELEKVRLTSSALMTVGETVDSFPCNLWSNKLPENLMVIELSNYLNVSLSNPQIYDPGHYLQELNPTPVPSIVGGFRKEKICFPFPEKIKSAEVLCSFKINTSDICLVVAIQRKFEDQNSTSIDWSGEQSFSIAFTPEEKDADEVLWGEMMSMTSDRKFRPDKKRSHSSATAENLIIKSGKYRAQASIVSTGPSFISLSLEVWSVDDPETLAQKHNLITEMYFLKVLEQGCCSSVDTVGSFDTSGKISCTVEIYNCLNTSLEDPFVYSTGGDLLTEMTTTISPLSKDVIFATHAGQLEAIFSYRIKDTDVRIAILFRINKCSVTATTKQPSYNDFAVGLIPIFTPTDDNLMRCFLQSHWRTRTDREFNNGCRDELSAEIRNIRLKAKMTGKEAAVLKIIVSTF
ncbi:unnamed protein product [Allacma fusca]|uniref:Uncharacterized protein n=1 Tax=Allacma fusca TaxID=39272 RepID=A0A8J2LMV3_9HEXA|nr:unnamed protein product [Allacma fusca]